jgi:hypothetical protein
MIHKIFFDLDETLLHTEVNADPCQECSVHTFDDEPTKIYYTMFRPCARRIVDFARELVGFENVHVLTTSVRKYAHRVNELGDLGFRHDQILAREDIEAHAWAGAYGHTNFVAHATLANHKNVLIDNLPPRKNEQKCSLIAVFGSRYIEVNDYWGVNFPSDPFEEKLRTSLTYLHNEP